MTTIRLALAKTPRRLYLAAHGALLLTWLLVQQEWVASAIFGPAACVVWWITGLRETMQRRDDYKAEVVRILGLRGEPPIPQIVAEIERLVDENKRLARSRRTPS